MKEIILQIWQQSDIDSGFSPDGCSLHIDAEEHRKFINSSYNLRNFYEIPDSYESVVGEPTGVLVNENIFLIMQSKKSVRLQQHEMNNLIGLKEIRIC